jgi:hypothetical protein
MPTTATKVFWLRTAFSSSSTSRKSRVARMSKIEGCSGTMTRWMLFTTTSSFFPCRPAGVSSTTWVVSFGGRAGSPGAMSQLRIGGSALRAQLQPFARGLLAVDVAEHDAVALAREVAGEVGRQRGLAAAALGVGDKE